MRRTLLPTVILAALGATAGVAAADSFGGFSGVDRFYMAGPDRVCTPLAVASGKATGVPTCEKAAADRVAKLSIKPAVAERGAKARFTASASGRTVTIKAGDRDVVLVEWTSLDPVTKVDAVYGSTYADMVAVELTVRRSGREATDVVGFDLGAGTGGTGTGTGSGTGTGTGSGTGTGTGTGSGSGTGTGTDPGIKVDKALASAMSKARGVSGAKAIAAWNKVLTMDPASSEGMYGLAAAQVKTGKKADAIATLEKLAGSTRADAIELRVAARFDKAFASIRSDAKFRTAVGLDAPPTTIYERVMGFGGQWEQLQTCGQNPSVKLDLTRDHKFKLAVRSKCSGDQYGFTFKGTWQVDTQGLLLRFPNKSRDEEATHCTITPSTGDEDVIKCPVDDDLEFSVLPVRR